MAFANTAGGRLLIGVEDETRHVRGASEPLDLEERVANLISDRIAPRLVPEIEILPWRRRQVPALQVQPSPSRAHFRTREGPTGGVYAGLTIEDLPHGVSRLRNRVIGRTFHALGLIEQWGGGIQPMTAACRAAGLAAPVFEELATRFRVTIGTTQVGPSLVDETGHGILETLGQGQGLATSEVAAAIGLSPHATRTRLARLVGRGLVREIGTGPQDPKRRRFRAEGGSA